MLVACGSNDLEYEFPGLDGPNSTDVEEEMWEWLEPEVVEW